MALGPWSGLHTMKVPYGPWSIGCPFEEEKTHTDNVEANNIVSPMVLERFFDNDDVLVLVLKSNIMYEQSCS